MFLSHGPVYFMEITCFPELALRGAGPGRYAKSLMGKVLQGRYMVSPIIK